MTSAQRCEEGGIRGVGAATGALAVGGVIAGGLRGNGEVVLEIGSWRLAGGWQNGGDQKMVVGLGQRRRRPDGQGLDCLGRDG